MAAEHLVPGVMRCAKCEFQLVRTNLYVNSGTAGPGDSRTEPCPNGCGPLWPITWKQWAEEAQKTAERFFDEAKAERAKVDELAMLVRRLAHALDKPRGNTLLARQAVDYLRRHGLQGSPLREGPTQETSPAPSTQESPVAERYQEYLRRNLLVAKAIGARENASTALKRLEMQSRPPQWLVNALRGILERVTPLPGDLARCRDLAPDAPDYVRAEKETRARRVTLEPEEHREHLSHEEWDRGTP